MVDTVCFSPGEGVLPLINYTCMCCTIGHDFQGNLVCKRVSVDEKGFLNLLRGLCRGSLLCRFQNKT